MPQSLARVVLHLAFSTKNRSSFLKDADFRARLKSDDTRELRRIATSALLALATPRLSGFMVSFYLGPYYERENRPDIAAAVYEDALKVETDPSERRALEEKIQSLRVPAAK